MASSDVTFKLLMIGNSGVGKTNIVVRYVNNSFSPLFVTTIGVDFKIKNINLGGKNVKLQIWDTAGQESFRSITSSYYRKAEGILLVYDITDVDTFAAIRHWISEIDKHAEVNVNKILVGNKCDMVDERRISYEEAEKLASEYGIPFYETSAKQSINIDKVFLKLASDVKERLDKEGSSQGPDNSKISITKIPPPTTRKSGCC